MALAVAPASRELLSVGLDDTFRCTPLPGEQFAETPGPVPLGGQPSDLDVAGDLAIVTTVNGVVLLREGKVSLFFRYGRLKTPSFRKVMDQLVRDNRLLDDQLCFVAASARGGYVDTKSCGSIVVHRVALFPGNKQLVVN